MKSCHLPTTWMELDRIMLSEISYAEISFTISLTYGLLKNSSSQIQERLMLARGGGWEVGEMVEGSQKVISVINE